MTIKRVRGSEVTLLRAVLDRFDGMLQPYGLAAEYSIDVQDNSYTASVHATGLTFDETWMRLHRYDELRAILEEVAFATDERERTLAIQRAGCMLDGRLPRAVK
jgi:hypothetical protein